MPNRLQGWCSAKELVHPTFWKCCFAEVMVSMYLVMFVTFCMISLNSDVYKLNTTHVGIMVGFLIFMLIEGYGPHSGGHMNPVVSFAFCLAGRITFMRAFFYTLAQCLGGVIGSGLVYGLCPEALREDFGPFIPGPNLGPGKGMIVELVLTFNLLFTCLSTSDETTHTVMLPSFPTAFAVGTGIMAAGTWTGACMNPIVALGPATISRNFTHHWIYWVGSYGGALLAVVVYKLYILAREKPAQTTDDCKKGEDDEERQKLRSEISTLVEKIIKLTSDFQTNANFYKDPKDIPIDITSSSGL